MIQSKDCLDLIYAFEGFRGSPYLCTGKKWTIGIGTTVYPNGKPVRPSDHPITFAKAWAIMRGQVDAFAKQVGALVKVPLQQCMFDALVSFAYNVGAGEKGLGGSTLLRLLNSSDYIGASGEFARWNKSGGEVTDGLVRRREAERLLFCGNERWREVAEITKAPN